jgi:hypothetical protein
LGLWRPSPDSRWLRGSELLPDGRNRFVLHRVATGDERGVDTTAGNVNVGYSAWSPDSRMLAYFDAADGFMKRLTVDSDAVVKLRQFQDVRGMAWGGQEIVFANNESGGDPML